MYAPFPLPAALRISRATVVFPVPASPLMSRVRMGPCMNCFRPSTEAILVSVRSSAPEPPSPSGDPAEPETSALGLSGRQALTPFSIARIVASKSKVSSIFKRSATT